MSAGDWRVRRGHDGAAAAAPTRPGAPPARPDKVGAGVVVYALRDGRAHYLLLQSAARPAEWAPPKGGEAHPGEAPLPCALRELYEETRLICAGDAHGAADAVGTVELDSGFEDPRQWPAHGVTKRMRFFLAAARCGPAADAGALPAFPAITLSEEHRDAEWLPLAEAQQRTRYPEMCSLLAAAEARIAATHAGA
jgi:8-oxo-dGTP pyrophosphatase MutT (NUDIX family)